MKLLAELVARILILIKRGEIEKKGKQNKRKAGGVANVATAQRAAQYMLTRDNLDTGRILLFYPIIPSLLHRGNYQRHRLQSTSST